MYQNTNHPNYDFDMEILCTIPRAPRYAIATEMSIDIGDKNQKRIRESIQRLKRLGLSFRMWKNDNGRVVSIEHESWRKAKNFAEAYWNDVYGGKRGEC